MACVDCLNRKMSLFSLSLQIFIIIIEMHIVIFTVRIECDSYEFIENSIVKISSQ